MITALVRQDRLQCKADNETSKLAKKVEDITTIPGELLHLISTHLPPPSAAIFSLCSRRLFSILGPPSLSYIREGIVKPHRMPWDDGPLILQPPYQTDRVIFLRLLGRDLPHLIFCHYCQRFHHPSKTGSDSNAELDAQRACTFVEGQDNRHLFFRQDFHFSDAQMLMQNYRLRKDCRADLEIISRPWEKVDAQGLKVHGSAKPRIIDGRLYIRTRLWFAIPRRPHFDHLPCIKDLAVCPHISVKESVQNDTLSFINRLKCATSHCLSYDQKANEDCALCHYLWQCTKCRTEYEIETRGVPSERAFKLAVTAWRDMGECVTPFDGVWMRHRTRWAVYMLGSMQIVPRSVRDIFEAGGWKGPRRSNRYS